MISKKERDLIKQEAQRQIAYDLAHPHSTAPCELLLNPQEVLNLVESLEQVERTLQEELKYGDAYLSEWERGRYGFASDIAEQIGFTPKMED